MPPLHEGVSRRQRNDEVDTIIKHARVLTPASPSTSSSLTSRPLSSSTCTAPRNTRDRSRIGNSNNGGIARSRSARMRAILNDTPTTTATTSKTMTKMYAAAGATIIPEAAIEPIVEHYVEYAFGRETNEPSTSTSSYSALLRRRKRHTLVGSSSKTSTYMPLYEATSLGDETSVFMLLMHWKLFAINRQQMSSLVECRSNSKGWTALNYAVHEGYIGIVQVLLELGHANVEARYEYDDDTSSRSVDDETIAYGKTPLIVAAERGYRSIVKILLQSGHADVNAYETTAIATNTGSSRLPPSRSRQQQRLETQSSQSLHPSNARNTTKQGITALMVACDKGYESIAQILLDQRDQFVNIHASNEIYNGYTALHYASLRGLESIVKQLIERGANINLCAGSESASESGLASSSSRDTGRGSAITGSRSSRFTITRNTSNTKKRTSLDLAVLGNHLSIARILLLHGAQVTTESFLIALYGGNDTMIQLLLRHGANPHERIGGSSSGTIGNSVTSGETPLYIAAKYGHFTTVERLIIEHSVDVNVTSKKDDLASALHQACCKGFSTRYHTTHTKNTRRISSIRSNSSGSSNKQPCVPGATGSGSVEYERIVKLLLDYGANIQARDEHGCSVLHYASRCPDGETIVKILLGYNIEQQQVGGEDDGGGRPLYLNVNDVVDNLGRTALHEAITYNRIRTARKLIDRGANINAIDNNGQTPLHLSAQESNIDTVQFLLRRRGAINLNIIDKAGNTPLHLATKRKNADIVQVLVSNGAETNVMSGHISNSFSCSSSSDDEDSSGSDCRPPPSTRTTATTTQPLWRVANDAGFLNEDTLDLLFPC